MKKTLYQHLGVSPTASIEEISLVLQKFRDRYDALERADHSQAASLLFIINDAQRLLLDSEQRKAYDQKLKGESSNIEISIGNNKGWSIPLVFVIIGVLVVIFLGEVHVVRGSSYDGSVFIRKATFGYSETFVNTDQILEMPWIAAKSQFPLGVKALIKVGFLESDNARKHRYEEKIEKKIEAVHREFEKNMEDAQKEMNELMKD